MGSELKRLRARAADLVEKAGRPERELYALLTKCLAQFFPLLCDDLLAAMQGWIMAKRRSRENNDRLDMVGAAFFAWCHGWRPLQAPIDLAYVDKLLANPQSEPLVAEHWAKALRRSA